jgi:hypothetical protein
MRMIRRIFLIAAAICLFPYGAAAQAAQSCPRVVDQAGWNNPSYGVTQDIGAVINLMFLTQQLLGQAGCVSLYGLPDPPAGNGAQVGAYWANTNPWAGVIGQNFVSQLEWPNNVIIVTSKAWDTPSQHTYIQGAGYDGGNNLGSVLVACPLTSCGPNNYPIFAAANYVAGPPLMNPAVSSNNFCAAIGGCTGTFTLLTTTGSVFATSGLNLSNFVPGAVVMLGSPPTAYTNIVSSATGGDTSGNCTSVHPCNLNFPVEWDSGIPNSGTPQSFTLFVANATAVFRPWRCALAELGREPAQQYLPRRLRRHPQCAHLALEGRAGSCKELVLQEVASL